MLNLWYNSYYLREETMNIGIVSLGCTKNLVDSEMILGAFKSQGYNIVNEVEEADIIIVNTCGFIQSAKEEAIKRVSEFMYKSLQEKIIREDFKVLRPMPSPIDKIQNKYRWRMILKGNIDNEINNIINKTLSEVYDQNVKDIRISVDVNPNNMM
jgi:hypothetical protein